MITKAIRLIVINKSISQFSMSVYVSNKGMIPMHEIKRPLP